MSDPNDELVEEFWAPENFSNIFFSAEESQQFLDSFLRDGAPPLELNTGNAHWILDRPRTRSEILGATREELRSWTRLAF